MKNHKENSIDLDTTERKFAILVTRWYEDVVQGLLSGARDTLMKNGARTENIHVHRVPGAFEMPLAAQTAARTLKFDGIVCLGAVIRGETPHFDYIAGEAARGLATVALETGIPVGFGILTCDTLDQALERSAEGPGNKGAEAATAVLEMLTLIDEFSD